jgi:beta-lactamase superfamily II metal-dependent hydrolase
MATRKPKRTSRIHLLDVGESQYGDCIFCEIIGERILIDGGHESDFEGSDEHPSIPAQLRALADTPPNRPTKLSLLVVSHAHADHVGCLPAMVEQGLITAEWALLVDPNLAWSSDEADDSSDAASLLAALREEPRYDLDSIDAFKAFADGAAKLQGNYRQMIRTLKSNGTKVVLHGTSPLAALEKRFAGIGLKVLGPSRAHLRACADRIHAAGRDFLRDATDALAADGEAFELYRILQQAWAKEIDPVIDAGRSEGMEDDAGATDAARNLGPVINLQSSAFILDDGTHRFLFTGDAQLERPEVADAAIDASIAKIFRGIRDHAPYDFVKLGHHGSYNAFGDTLLSSIGEQSKHFGICTGANSKHHPSRRAIDLLKARGRDVTWARTDKNGAVTFAFTNGALDVTKARGRLNDSTLPMPDERTAPLPGLSAHSPELPPMSAVATGALPTATVPIEIRIPYVPGIPLEVSLTLRVAAPESQPAKAEIPTVATIRGPDSTEPQTLNLAAGRNLPQLLFLTHSGRLAANIGREAADRVLLHLREKGHVVVEAANSPGTTPLEDACAAARTAINEHSKVCGVVILGGYDVVPAQRRDVAPGAPQAVRLNDQEDRYVVWSDAVYADTDGDGMAELPVSRIPDGRSEQLVVAALSVPAYSQLQNRHGLRNAHRPFADKIYKRMKGSASMLQSHPHPDGTATYEVCGDHVYLMLHGDYDDATRFWGERSDNSVVEALHIDQVRINPGTIVFTGCCWGALPVRELASMSGSDHPTPRTTADSIALRCLSQGARAFVGCTGMHYSPQGLGIDTVSGPLHDGFWRRIGEGMPPAKALFEAKTEYIAHPARAKSNRDRKIFEQFTVLGLGW